MNLFEFSANFPDVISAKAAWKTFRDRRGVTCKKYNSKKRYWLQNISQYQRTATVPVTPNATNNTTGSTSTVTATIKTDCLDASGNNILESITQTLTRPGFSSFANSPTGACSNGYQNWTLSPVATVASSISADLHVIPESVELYTQTSSIAIAVRTKKQIVQDNNQAIFNLKGLIPGYYFVHVVYTDGIEIRTVQVI